MGNNASTSLNFMLALKMRNAAEEETNREGHRGLTAGGEAYCRREAKEGARATGEAHRRGCSRQCWCG